MKKYEVLSDRVTGLDGRSYTKGKHIFENNLRPGVAPILVRRGRLKELFTRSIPLTGKIKLAIVTSVWKRPEIFEMFAKGVNNLINKCNNFEITIVVSGSEWLESHKMVTDHGFTYIEVPNEPLAAKVNASTYACKKLNIDYVICVGSDDIISPELLNEYEKYMRKGIDFIGVTDCYFYDVTSKKSLYWGGYTENYRKGHTVGAFRALSARILSLWDWMPWENRDSNGLDRSMQDKLKKTPHSIHTFNMKSLGLFALDIKSSTNMTKFRQWDNSNFIDSKIIKNQFSYVFD
jgi:hypothetical protein